MSKTPRTDAVIAKYQHVLQYTDLLRYCKDMTANSEQLEAQLADMRTIFVRYVLSEEAWRESKKNPTPMLIEANFMREKAKEVLGL